MCEMATVHAVSGSWIPVHWPLYHNENEKASRDTYCKAAEFFSFFSPFKSGMEEVIVDEVRQFTSLLSQLTGQPINMASQFNLPILNALWRITVGDRFEYTDPQLLDLIRRMGLFLQKLASPATLIALTQPWIFKVGFLTILFIKWKLSFFKQLFINGSLANLKKNIFYGYMHPESPKKFSQRIQ